MNRSQRRFAQKVHRQTGCVPVDERMLGQLATAQRFFLAIVKAQGRVRVSKADLDALREGDRVTSKDDGAGGLVLSFVPAEPEEAAPPQEATNGT